MRLEQNAAILRQSGVRGDGDVDVAVRTYLAIVVVMFGMELPDLDAVVGSIALVLL